MFHQGTLQSGITLAIQEQKGLACLISDNGSESAIWQDEWLKSGYLSSLLEQKAVLLRLQAGSTEAGFLSAFCTISTFPTFIVIHNGQLQEQIQSGVSQDDFINRIRKVLGASPIPGTAQPAAGSSPQIATPEPEAAQIPPLVQPAPSTQPTATVTSAPSAPIPPPSARAQGKQPVAQTPASSAPQLNSATSKAQQSAREALRKKKQEEKEELERIKARIEANKAERKAQAEAAKADRERLAQTESEPAASSSISTSSRGSNAKEVNLNVRMFDGATIRSKFPRTATLQDDVRPWIDQEFTARAEDPNERHPPYYFKQILAPLPSRELSAGEEGQSLGDIDLAPSATLVLLPIKGYTDAYAGNSGGIVSGAASGVFGLVGGAFNLAGSAVGFVGNTLYSVVGGGRSTQPDNQRQQQREQEQEQPSAQGRSLGDSQQDQSGIRVRTLADQRSREGRDNEFYNGNQLNFEPRNDDSGR